MKSPKPFLRVVAAAGAAIVLLATPAQADILLEFDDLIFGAKGSVRTVAEAQVPADLVGRTCQISVIAENQASVHPGNDLIVSTGDSEAVIVGVEDEVNGGTTETYQVVVGPAIVVQLRFGADEMSSLGFGLSFDCDQPVTTTVDPTLDGQQVADGSSSTTAPPSTVATTIPTAGVSAGCDDTGPDTDVAGSTGGVTEATVGTDADSGATATTTCVPTSCSDSDDRAGVTGPSGSSGSDLAGGEAAPITDCPDGAAVAAPASTATTAPPTTSAAPPTIATSTTTEAPVASSTAIGALPEAPAANAIVAAPAYAG